MFFENGRSFKCWIYFKAIEIYSEEYCVCRRWFRHGFRLRDVQFSNGCYIEKCYKYTVVQKDKRQILNANNLCCPQRFFLIDSVSLSCSWSATTRPNTALTFPRWGSTGNPGWYGAICCPLAANAGDEMDVSCQVRCWRYWCQDARTLDCGFVGFLFVHQLTVTEKPKINSMQQTTVAGGHLFSSSFSWFRRSWSRWTRISGCAGKKQALKYNNVPCK